jgi:anti-anti-sigma factor
VKITETRQGAIIVLKPEGPLIDQDAATLKQRLMDLMSSSLGRFVLDMSAIPYVDSLGLEALVDVTEELARSGQALRLCAANKTVREVMEITDTAPLFDHFEDSNTAVRSFL